MKKQKKIKNTIGSEQFQIQSQNSRNGGKMDTPNTHIKLLKKIYTILSEQLQNPIKKI